MGERNRVDEHRDSLADQAASWVPPWQRERSGEPGPETAEQNGGAAAEVEAGQADVGRTAERESSAAAVEDVPVPSAPTAPPAALALMHEAELRAALEAILLVVDEPVADAVLAGVVQQPTERVTEAMAALSAGYTAEGRGFDLRRAAGGWRLYTRPEYAAYVERFVLDGQQARLTQAALETLAVVAYKQPVTRSRISAIRGVNCDGVIRTLVNRGLVEECGTEPDSGAYLYRTTTLFLEKLGLDSVGELPPLAPFLPDDVDGIADGQG
jgi:segregation and condensation protein B